MTLFSHSTSTAHQGTLSIRPYTQKKIAHLVSVSNNLDCMRVEFFQYLPDDFEVLPRSGFI